MYKSFMLGLYTKAKNAVENWVDIETPLPDAPIPDRPMAFVWFFAKQIKWPLLTIFIINIFSHGFEALQYGYIKWFIEVIEKGGQPATIWQEIMPLVISFTLLVLITQPLLARISTFIFAGVRPNFVSMMRRQMAQHMRKQTYDYFLNDYAGRLSSKIFETPRAVIEVTATLIGPIMFAAIGFVVSLGLFMATHWSLVVVSLVWFTSYVLIMRHYVPKVLSSSKETYEEVSRARGRLVDSLTNILSIKLFSRSRYEDDLYTQSLRKTAKTAQNMMHTINYQGIWLEIISTLFIAAGFFLSIYLWQIGEFAIADMSMSMALVIRLMHASWWMSETFVGLFEQIGQVQEGMEELAKEASLQDKAGAKPVAAREFSIKLDNVTFAYPGRPMFKDFTLEVKPGQKIGLVGPSGAGKSTLTKLLMRLHDVQEGAILLGNQDIRDVTQDSLREHIAVIPQVPELFHRSIKDNITYGRLDATENEIIEASKRAGAHEFIVELRDKSGRTGYETMVGERGVKLSGGQRQRVALARAILKDAPVLILDEATSSLDSESEQAIQKALVDLMKNKTVIAIAHRLSTIAYLDRLLVMDEGVIVEDGTHAELLQKGGLYARLWNLQSGGFLGDLIH